MSLPVTNSPDDAPGEPSESTSVMCSLCGTNIYQPKPYGKPILNPAIQQEYGNAASVQLSLIVGEQSWDWGAGEITSFDLCPTCFTHKLAPWLELQGAVAKPKAWSR